MTGTVCLPARLDLPAAQPLAAALRERAGAPLRIDAGDVVFLGGLCLQVLIAAALLWRQGGVELTVEPRSEPFEGALAIFGLALSGIQSEASA
ncbi:MAG: STAS domain-containing protein [Paracoccaceae bacterium]